MSSNPTTIYGRPINEAFTWSFTAGIGFMQCFAALIYVLITRGRPTQIAIMTQYATHFMGSVFTLMNFGSLLSPGGCPLTVALSELFRDRYCRDRLYCHYGRCYYCPIAKESHFGLLVVFWLFCW